MYCIVFTEKTIAAHRESRDSILKHVWLRQRSSQSCGVGAQAILDVWSRSRSLKFGIRFHSPSLCGKGMRVTEVLIQESQSV